MYSVVGSLKATEGQHAELEALLLEAASEMSKVENCYSYLVGCNETEPDTVFTVEIWESKEAHEASLTMEVFQNLIAKAKPIIAGMDGFPRIDVVGGKLR